ncbi:hypothetical protein HZS_3073, partial [Henneguya salminicola]
MLKNYKDLVCDDFTAKYINNMLALSKTIIDDCQKFGSNNDHIKKIISLFDPIQLIIDGHKCLNVYVALDLSGYFFKNVSAGSINPFYSIFNHDLKFLKNIGTAEKNIYNTLLKNIRSFSYNLYESFLHIDPVTRKKEYIIALKKEASTLYTGVRDVLDEVYKRGYISDEFICEYFKIRNQ